MISKISMKIIQLFLLFFLMQFFLQNYQKILFFQIDTKIILFQWENKRKRKNVFNNQNVLFYFFTIFIHFSIKNISYSITFSLFLQKIIFVFFPKREEINERNCYGIFYTFSLILKWCRKNSNQIKISFNLILIQ